MLQRTSETMHAYDMMVDLVLFLFNANFSNNNKNRESKGERERFVSIRDEVNTINIHKCTLRNNNRAR